MKIYQIGNTIFVYIFLGMRFAKMYVKLFLVGRQTYVDNYLVTALVPLYKQAVAPSEYQWLRTHWCYNR